MAFQSPSRLVNLLPILDRRVLYANERNQDLAMTRVLAQLERRRRGGTICEYLRYPEPENRVDRVSGAL